MNHSASCLRINLLQVRKTPFPKTASETLKYLISNLYTERFSDVYALMEIFAVTPVTSATGERSFSTLKIEKNYLRSRMGNDRLNGLTLTNIHKEYRIDHDRIARKYLEKPLGDLPLTAEPTREINLADMEDADEIDQQGLDPELHGLDADE